MRIARLISLGLIAGLMLMIPAQSNAQVAVGISVQFAPPALPVYEQPICPGYGYIWTPGYWGYGYDGFFWVPGTWVLAPAGMLWTPGYWAWENEAYLWYPGYWGPEVGFYGGIVYGFGYVGRGYEGGYWSNGALYYNRSVNNITNVTNITNVYNKSVSNNVTVNNVSFSGGPGGTTERPTPQELAAARAPHTQPTSAQVQHEHAASSNRAQWASVNQGKPGIAATGKPGEFSGRGVVSASAAAPYRPMPSPAPGSSAAQPEKPNRPANPTSNPAPSNPRTPSAQPENPKGNASSPLEMKRQQESQKLQQKQNQERQNMERKHQQELQKLQQNSADQRRQLQVQQKHQQQTQQLEQKHSQQQQQLQQRQQAQQQKEQKTQ